MRDPQTFETPLAVEITRRRRGGMWFLTFLASVFMMACATLLTQYWKSHPGLVFSSIVVLGVLGGIASNVLVNALYQFRTSYKELLNDYREVCADQGRRAKFMINFPTDFEDVSVKLQSQAYKVLRYHRMIVELHEKGITAPETSNPDTQLSTLKRNFDEKLQGLERLMRIELERFRELRDVAKWAGESRYKVRGSWWDYINPRDLPKRSKRSLAMRGELVEGANEPPSEGEGPDPDPAYSAR